MIAQIKTLANAKEIEVKQKDYQFIVQQNKSIEQKNKELSKAKRIMLLDFPTIPEPEYKGSDLLFDIEHVTLAFVNSTGEISIKYQGDNFNLIYSDEVWETLKVRFTEKKCKSAACGIIN